MSDVQVSPSNEKVLTFGEFATELAKDLVDNKSQNMFDKNKLSERLMTILSYGGGDIGVIRKLHGRYYRGLMTPDEPTIAASLLELVSENVALVTTPPTGNAVYTLNPEFVKFANRMRVVDTSQANVTRLSQVINDPSGAKSDLNSVVFNGAGFTITNSIRHDLQNDLEKLMKIVNGNDNVKEFFPQGTFDIAKAFLDKRKSES